MLTPTRILQCVRSAVEAYRVLGLQPHCTVDNIKSRYRELVKVHDPDTKSSTSSSSTSMEDINRAYQVLVKEGAHAVAQQQRPTTMNPVTTSPNAGPVNVKGSAHPSSTSAPSQDEDRPEVVDILDLDLNSEKRVPEGFAYWHPRKAKWAVFPSSLRPKGWTSEHQEPETDAKQWAEKTDKQYYKTVSDFKPKHQDIYEEIRRKQRQEYEVPNEDMNNRMKQWAEEKGRHFFNKRWDFLQFVFVWSCASYFMWTYFSVPLNKISEKKQYYLEERTRRGEVPVEHIEDRMLHDPQHTNPDEITLALLVLAAATAAAVGAKDPKVLEAQRPPMRTPPKRMYQMYNMR